VYLTHLIGIACRKCLCIKLFPHSLCSHLWQGNSLNLHIDALGERLDCNAASRRLVREELLVLSVHLLNGIMRLVTPTVINGYR
jgi:hypothetical protein